jgi:hypothetical protein
MAAMRRVLLGLATIAGLSSWASPASAQGVELFAVLAGGNEVTDDGKAAVGDPNGFGAASVIFPGAAGRLCFSLLVTNIDTPRAAHIHEALPGKNGPIVVPLTPIPSAGSPGTSSGCVRDVSAAVLTRLRTNPTGFYVNVHTGAFPAGAIRGQLF